MLQILKPLEAFPLGPTKCALLVEPRNLLIAPPSLTACLSMVTAGSTEGSRTEEETGCGVLSQKQPKDPCTWAWGSGCYHPKANLKPPKAIGKVAESLLKAELDNFWPLRMEQLYVRNVSSACQHVIIQGSLIAGVRTVQHADIRKLASGSGM